MIRNVRLLYLHNFLTDFRFQEAFLVIWFAQIMGSYTAAMTVLALATVTSALMDIPAGIFSDRIGRKYTLILSSVCTTLMVVCFAFAHNAVLLYVGGVFNGLSQCLFNGNNDALLYESLKSEKREGRFHHYQGRAKSMYQLALCLSALGASLLTSHGLRYIFMLGIIPQIMSFFVSLFFIEPKVHVAPEKNRLAHLKKACNQIWRNPRLRLVMIGQAISYGAGESNFYFKSAYVNVLWPSWAVGLYRGLNHALGFTGFWLSGRILDRIKAPHFLALRELYWFVSQMIAILMSNVFTPLLMLTGAAVYGPGEIARDQILQKEFSDAQRATMGSVGTFMSSVVYAIMAFLIGVIADRFGLAAGVGFGVVVNVTSLPIYIYLFRKYF